MDRMEKGKSTRLRAAGWKIADPAEFLGLSTEEAAYVEMRLALSRALRTCRRRCGLTQTALAEKLQSSQSRVAKMESGDPTVSFDLLIRGLLAAGATQVDIAGAITGTVAEHFCPDSFSC